MPDQTITELLAPFGRYLRTSSDLLPRSQESYLEQVRLFAESLGDPFLADLTPQALVDWHSECVDRGLRANTLTLKRSALRQFFIWLDEVLEDPQGDRMLRILRRIKAPRESHQTERKTFALDDESVIKMLTAAGRGPTGGRDRPMLHFLWATGVRRQELVTVKLKDLDMERRRVRVLGKGEKERSIRFTTACQQDLEAWLRLRATRHATTDALFISVRGGPIHPNTINPLFKKWAKKAGIREDIWPHLMRHTRITELVNRLGLPNAARFAGHSNVNTTMGYVHEDPEEMDRLYDLAMGEASEPEEN
ncbi:MAG: tyrosine-type recombinase/integrase [Pseudomonadota bacterium]|nr:tyrosine-type recombinase/integrase [Pseudomonadota bacterium]